MKISKAFGTAGASLAVLMNAACASGPSGYYGGYGQAPFGGQPVYGGPVGSMGRYEPPACRQLASLQMRAQQSRGMDAAADLGGAVLGGILTGDDRVVKRAIQNGTSRTTRGAQQDMALQGQITVAQSTCDAERRAQQAGTTICNDRDYQTGRVATGQGGQPVGPVTGSIRQDRNCSTTTITPGTGNSQAQPAPQLF